MTASDMIKEYGILLETKSDASGKRILTGRLFVANAQKANRDNMVEVIRFQKDEIAEILIGEYKNAEKKAAEREQKIKEIPGLAEIRKAVADIDKWHREFNKSFERGCGGLGVRPKPKYDLESMKKQYPRAAAYLYAEGYSFAANYAKAAAGRKALEKIIDGDDPEIAIKEMENEWATEAHRWVD